MDIPAYLKSLDYFGRNDPKQMPSFFFYGAKFIDYKTAIKADISKQNFTVAPRHWYIDCDLDCVKCHREFVWTAREQRVWFEQYQLNVTSRPWRCKACKMEERRLIDLRKEYDATVSAVRDHGTVEQKSRILEIIRELQVALPRLPPRMLDTIQLLERQIHKAKQADAANQSRRGRTS